MGGKIYLIKGYYKEGNKHPFYSYEHDLSLERCIQLATALFEGDCDYVEVLDLETLEQVYNTKQKQ